MTAVEASTTRRIRIADIRPTPPDGVAEAIALALETAWPESVIGDQWSPGAKDAAWRFGGRRWKHRAVPMRTWGRA